MEQLIPGNPQVSLSFKRHFENMKAASVPIWFSNILSLHKSMNVV
jgi:hypothetical protein